jgi:ATP-dependent RNA helicase SUPV3L1/SUV3
VLGRKIKRLVFNATWKWDGKQEALLSTRHLKQIAGRAGRFGLHADNSSGGIVTAVYERSMDAIREALAAPTERLRKARLQPPMDQFNALLRVLPARIPLSTVFSVFHYVGKPHPTYELQDSFKPAQEVQLIDDICGGLAITHRLLLRQAPFRWRDHISLPLTEYMLHMFRDSLHVKMNPFVKATGILKTVKDCERMMEQGKVSELNRILPNLEGIHAILVAYTWLGYRLPVSFPDSEEANALKERAEKVMSWILEKRSGRSRPNNRSRHGSPF